MIISGRIRAIDEEKRIILVEYKGQVYACYFQRALMLHVSRYLMVDRYIQVVVGKDPRMLQGVKVYTVDYVKKIMQIRYRKNIVYYDERTIKKGTKDLLNQLGCKLFLDLEMSMHPYKKDPNFVQEIIQVGYILTDSKDQILETYDEIVKPSIHKKLSKRTLKFLEITQEEVDKGIDFKDFYKHFANLIKKYDPAIIVWGKNDFLALREGYQVNNLPSLKHQTRYINLLKIIKNYFHLRNDIGLFNALELFHGKALDQSHNAYEDAHATMQIFHQFLKVVNHQMKVDTSHLI
jgi:sporulation inhibitor KapD